MSFILNNFKFFSLFFIFCFLMSFILDDSSNFYEEKLSEWYGNEDDLSYSYSDYVDGHEKFKGLFVPVPITSEYKAADFTYSYLSDLGFDDDISGKFYSHAKNIIDNSNKMSFLYLSDSTYLSNSGINFCYISLRRDNNYSGLKNIALDHEMAHCYLESKGMGNLFEYSFSSSGKDYAIEKFKKVFGEDSYLSMLSKFNSFLIESFSDSFSLYNNGLDPDYVSDVISNRKDIFLSSNIYSYATHIVLSRVDFNILSRDDFEDELLNTLSSRKIVDSFIEIANNT